MLKLLTTALMVSAYYAAESGGASGGEDDPVPGTNGVVVHLTSDDLALVKKIMSENSWTKDDVIYTAYGYAQENGITISEALQQGQQAIEGFIQEAGGLDAYKAHVIASGGPNHPAAGYTIQQHPDDTAELEAFMKLLATLTDDDDFDDDDFDNDDIADESSEVRT